MLWLVASLCSHRQTSHIGKHRDNNVGPTMLRVVASVCTGLYIQRRKLFIPSGNDWVNMLVGRLCLSKSLQDFGSYRDTERVELHGEILLTSARCRKSCHKLDRDLRNPQTSWRDLGNLDKMEEISPWSHRDSEIHKHHGEISTNLGEMEDILLRSRRDLESHKHHAEISTNLSEISVNSARWRISRRDLAKI